MDHRLEREDLDLSKLYSGYVLARDSINAIRSQVLTQLSASSSHRFAEFNFFTPEEVNEKFNPALREIEYGVMLMMLSAVEAFIRTDFSSKRFGKDKFDLLTTNFGSRIPLEEILNIWKTSDPATTKAIGEYNGSLILRNWLAHGRHYSKAIGRKNGYNSENIFLITSNVVSAILNSSIY